MPLHIEVGIELLCEKRNSEETPSFQGVGFGGSEDFPILGDFTAMEKFGKFSYIGKKSRTIVVMC